LDNIFTFVINQLKDIPMKKNYRTFNGSFLALLLILFISNLVKAQITTQTFSYTGAIQTFTAPVLCVNTITIDARGAGNCWPSIHSISWPSWCYQRI
jgi:hypothetical protein